MSQCRKHSIHFIVLHDNGQGYDGLTFPHNGQTTNTYYENETNQRSLREIIEKIESYNAIIFEILKIILYIQITFRIY